MPYIMQDARDDLAPDLISLIENLDAMDFHPGALNYVITVLCKHAIEARGCCYENLNMVIGVLESAKMEFYRRDVSLYENKKIAENGDVEVKELEFDEGIEDEEEDRFFIEVLDEPLPRCKCRD